MKKLPVTYRATIDRHVKITVRTQPKRKSPRMAIAFARWRIPA